MHTSVTYSPCEVLLGMESPGRVEGPTSTHDSRVMTALSIPLLVQGSPPKASPFSRTSDKWCTKFDDHVYNSFVDDSTGCNHQLGARVGPRVTQIARSRGVLPQIAHTQHA